MTLRWNEDKDKKKVYEPLEMTVQLVWYENMTQPIGKGEVIGKSTGNMVKFINQNLVKYKVPLD